MKKIDKRKSIYQNAVKISMFLLSLAIVLHFLPKQSFFRYDFQMGKPWHYGLLTAPYDFQVYKSDKAVQAEKDSALKNFSPYFKIDKKVGDSNIEKFQNDFDKFMILTTPKKYKSYIVSQLSKLYDIGIISAKDLSNIDKDSVLDIMVVNNNLAEKISRSNLYTEKHAYEIIFENLPDDISPNILKKCQIENYLVTNLTPYAELTENERKKALEYVSLTSGMIQRGERIIDKGDIVLPSSFRVLRSLKIASDKRSKLIGGYKIIFGQLIICLVVLILLFFYLWFYRPIIYERKANIAFLLIMFTGFTVLCSFVVKYTALNVYLIPFAIVPIMIRTFFDSRTAFFFHVGTILVCSLIVPFNYEFLVLQVLIGMVVMFSLTNLTQRSQLVFCSLFVFVTYCVSYFGAFLIQESFNSDYMVYFYFFVNSLLVLLSYLLIYLFEWMFGYTSNVTLMELSNINNPLLRIFSEVCPGSFQHSMQVSNLATAAAQKINANVELARTGALYHDIGKMSNPQYFTENQSGYNPHDELTSEQSVAIITNHVTEGLVLANKHGLPLVVRQFIRSHHGISPVRYFYNKFKNKYPDKDVPDCFYYKGENPSSKETAIVMMADSVEAASRSLNDYSEKNISDLIEKIIDVQISDGSYKDVPITFRDLEKIKEVFKDKLKSIYHTRIKYPEDISKKNKEEESLSKNIDSKNLKAIGDDSKKSRKKSWRKKTWKK